MQAVDQNPPTRNLTAPRRNLAAIGSATDGDPTPTDKPSPVESGRTWYRVASWLRAGSFFTGRPAALENQGAFAPFDAAVRIDVPSASAAHRKQHRRDAILPPPWGVDAFSSIPDAARATTACGKSALELAHLRSTDQSTTPFPISERGARRRKTASTLSAAVPRELAGECAR